jgi:hypothetical protein
MGVDARRAFFPKMLTLGAHPLARVAVNSPKLAFRYDRLRGGSKYSARQRSRPDASFSRHSLSSEASQPGSGESIASRSHGCPNRAYRCAQSLAAGAVCPQGRLFAVPSPYLLRGGDFSGQTLTLCYGYSLLSLRLCYSLR